MKTEILVTCPVCCQSGFTERGLRSHFCRANGGGQISKQDWWMAVDKARVAAGQPEMIYGYELDYLTATGAMETFHGAGTKSAVVSRAKLKTLFKRVIETRSFTYKQYCNAFGIPGSKM